jgi:hypothetical protein
MNDIDEKLLQAIVPRFRTSKEAEGQQWREERQEKDRFFDRYFSKEGIDTLDEGTLREFIHILWAFSGWTNKDYLFDEMMNGGLSTVRGAFKRLLYGSEPVAVRFDFVRNNVRMMDTASISEILAHHDHHMYPIWNSRNRRGLIRLGVNESRQPKSTQITGRQYATFCKLALHVRKQIAEQYLGFEDFFELNSLLYFTSLQPLQAKQLVTTPPEKNGVEDFNHGEVIDQLLELEDSLRLRHE